MLLALIAVVFAGLGARDQVTLAHLVGRQGARPGMLVTAIAVSIVSAAIAAWAAIAIAPQLAPTARGLLAAMALGFAGVESLLLAPGKPPKEPTRSLGALAIVLLAHQLTDAARFLIFAIAVAFAAPFPAAVGGAVGGTIVLTAAWLAPELASDPRLRIARRAVGAAMLAVALGAAWRALH